jgi:hypothetical protein
MCDKIRMSVLKRIGNIKPLFTRAQPLAPPRTPPVSPRPPGAPPPRQRWTPQAGRGPAPQGTARTGAG